NFTLVATVSIDGVPRSGSVPLMGVLADSDGGTKLMELSYGSGKKWQVLCCDGTTAELNSTWDPETQYQVAIVLQNGKQGSVYVDGQRVCGSAQRGLEATESQEISHFYIGGDGGSAGGQGDVSVTVRNVLLYNRPLTFSGPDAEVEKDVASPAGAGSRTKTGGEIKRRGSLPTHSKCRRLRAPMPLEKRRTMPALCVGADYCHHCCFCCGTVGVCGSVRRDWLPRGQLRPPEHRNAIPIGTNFP
ncbi:trans-sialidase, putative, partial [Trypanosoma cruzi]